MSYFHRADFVGPPSPDDMSGVARAALCAGNLERARGIADVMVDHWQHIAGDVGACRFYWWLGFAGAVASMQISADAAARDRFLSKPARRPVSNRRTS